MGTALFITREDLTKNSILNGNIDVDKFIPYIKIAQDVHIQNYLGTDLYEKLQTIINDGLLELPSNSNYLALVNDYIKPMLINWSMVEYLPFAAYTVANKGVYKHQSENSETVDKNEVDYLVEKQRDIAQNYTQRFLDWICVPSNQSKFPEYNFNNTNDGGVNPDQSDADFMGWVI